jgi:hypothetical protein
MGVVIEWADLANVLEAQERLASFTDAIAAGSMTMKGGAKNHMRDLQRQASGKRRGAASKPEPEAAAVTEPQSMEAATLELAAFGIGVEVVSKTETAQANE